MGIIESTVDVPTLDTEPAVELLEQESPMSECRRLDDVEGSEKSERSSLAIEHPPERRLSNEVDPDLTIVSANCPPDGLEPKGQANEPLPPADAFEPGVLPPSADIPESSELSPPAECDEPPPLNAPESNESTVPSVDRSEHNESSCSAAASNESSSHPIECSEPDEQLSSADDSFADEEMGSPVAGIVPTSQPASISPRNAESPCPTGPSNCETKSTG